MHYTSKDMCQLMIIEGKCFVLGVWRSIYFFYIHIAREMIRITSLEWGYRIERKIWCKTVFTYSKYFTLLRHLDWKSNWIHRCTARHCNGIKCFHLSLSKWFSLFNFKTNTQKFLCFRFDAMAKFTSNIIINLYSQSMLGRFFLLLLLL